MDRSCKYWTGAVNTDWHNPENWNITGPPSKLYDVTIPDVANDPIVNSPTLTPAACKSIILESGVFMQVKSEFIPGVTFQELLASGLTIQELLASGLTIQELFTFRNI